MRTVATGVGTIDRIAPLPDGRTLLIRAPGEMLVLASNGVTGTYVFEQPAGAVESIADIAVPPSFARDHFVFLAVVLRDGDSARVRVIRLHESNGVFGDATTLIADVLVDGDGMPAITADANGRVFLSLPAGATLPEGVGSKGMIVAFMNDGRPDGAVAGSMSFASGVDRPGALAIADDRLWVADARQPLSSALKQLALTTPAQQVMVANLSATNAVGVGGLAVTNARGALVAESPRALIVFELTEAGNVTGSHQIPLGDLQPLAVAATADGAWLVSAMDPRDQNASVLLELHSESSIANH